MEKDNINKTSAPKQIGVHKRRNSVDIEVMNDKDALQLAIIIATKAHEGQLDRGGMPYIGHVMRVVEA